jgi:CelD/BcsL family acetyltransferase involved in cellulose biosynthesis
MHVAWWAVNYNRGNVAKDVCALVGADDALCHEWDTLALATAAPPFLRPGWVRAWMAAFAPRRQLQLLTVRRDEQLVALLPVVTRMRQVVAPVNAETPVMGPLAVDDRAAGALLPGLLARTHHADLRFLPEGDHARALVAEAEARGLRWRCETVRRSPYTRVDGDWDTFCREVLSARRRKRLRRQEEKLAGLGHIDLTVHDGTVDRVEFLSEGLRLELAGWKGEQGTAVLSRPRTAQFYRSVADWAAEVGILRLYFLRLNGRAIAFGYRLEQQGVIYGVKIAYAEKFREYGPGLLLMHGMMVDAFGRAEVRSVEWQGEADPHKLDFASGVREQLRLQLFSGGPAGALDHGMATAVHTARAEAVRRLSPETRRRVARTFDWVRAAVPGAGTRQ